MAPKYGITLSLGVCMMLSSPAQGQLSAKNGGPAPGTTKYSTVQQISTDDSSEVIAGKAAKVLPRPNQTAWMRLERTFFIHFGPNTFRGVEWGDGREDASVFNPTQLDADQWVRAIKDAGGKMVILVCKHHDGFVLWPTRYTNHSVASSPWRGGKGSVVRDVADAAHKYGIKLGVYLSPADLYQLRTNPKNPAGYYGDGSAKLRSVIPTDAESFKTTVGHKRLLRWNSPVTTDRVRIRIAGSRLEPTLAEIGLFKQADYVKAPVISERDASGLVTISDAKGLPVVYTTDGTAPTPKSATYSSPIVLRRGGTVNAACLGSDGSTGFSTSRSRWSSLVPVYWDTGGLINRSTGAQQDPDAINWIVNATR